MTAPPDKSDQTDILSSKRIEREELSDGSLVFELERYWSSLQVNGSVPLQEDVDAVDIESDLLPWLFLMDVLRGPDGLDYRYRLVGTANVQLNGRDPTGQLASDVFGTKERRFMIKAYDTTVQEKAPTFWSATAPQDTYGTVRYDRGLFPLSDASGEVSRLICAAVKSL